MAPAATARPNPELPRWMRSSLPGVLIDGRDEDRRRLRIALLVQSAQERYAG